MTLPIFRPHLITVFLGVLLGSASVPAGNLWAAESSSTPGASASQKNAAHDRTALNAIGQARYFAQNHRARDLVDRIERAETALLNVEQIGRDSHIDAALQHLDAARALASSNDLRAAEAELAAATADVAIALVAAAPAMTAAGVPVIGYAVPRQDSPRSGASIGVPNEQVFHRPRDLV